MAKISITFEDAVVNNKPVVSMKIEHDVVPSNDPPTPAMTAAMDMVKHFHANSRAFVEEPAVPAVIEEPTPAAAAGGE